jgi:hypothetical protein
LICADFLEWSTMQTGGGFDLVVMNPPFAYPPPPGGKKRIPVWTSFLQAALRMRACGGIALILGEVGFLFGLERTELYRQQPPSEIYASPRRLDYLQQAGCGQTADFESIWVQWGPHDNPSSTTWHWLWSMI